MSYTKTTKKLLTGIITFTLLASFSPVSVFASCSPEEQYQINTEIRMMESIITAPSPAQRRENYLERINAIASTLTTAEKEVQGLIFNHYPNTLSFEEVRHIDFKTEIVDPNNITNGRGELHTITLYEDAATGYSVDGIDFNIENGVVTHFELDPLVPEAAIQAAREDAKELQELGLLEPTVKKEVIQEPKQPITLPLIENELTPQEIHEKAKVSAQVTKEELEMRKDSNCTVVVSASNGEYDRIKAIEYAWRHASDNTYNPDYPNYDITSDDDPDGGDCTNFASQVVQAGGLRQDTGHGAWWNRDDTSETKNWYVRRNIFGGFDHSKSWTSVNHFLIHMRDHENTGDIMDFQERGFEMFNDMQVGDVLFADMEENGLKNHTMIITGWDMVDGQRRPRLSYHTSNRNHISFEKFKDLTENKFHLYGLKIISEIY
ncbi:hypothetical protein NIES267_73680 (plasmid) [Calothrix parasitica NIES-267]|uniref:Putative amidase domain-containing protein n=1 Tax=Calothrix parasitica NIES-267 TaxID=1973488 RepID=A0A1Z4M2W7_9CYAN|nr:hypothetical protein NIES267_73680 [Calothrix parasitica NIES-267]